MLTVNIAIFIPFLAAILIPFLYKKLSRLHIGWFVLAIPITLFIIIAQYVPSIANGETHINTLNWIPSFQINFISYVDGLSIIFGLLITGIGSLVTLYSIYYLSPKESLQHFYCYLLLFMGSMLGVVFSDHLLVLYVFWELTSISSFLLIAFWYHRKGSRYGAQKSLLLTISGGFAMLIGFLMIYTMAETFSIREIIPLLHTIETNTLFLPAMFLILLGAFAKSAQFPFHIWLPDAMEAPTPVSAYLHSATMVKAGIYLVARFTPIFGGEVTWFWFVSSIGLITLFWGSFSAIRQTDLKALLAYSTVSQLGLIMCLIGISSASLHPNINSALASQAAFAGLFHLINHSTFKGALFMVIGIVDFQVGTRDVRRLGGLIAFMPISFTIALIGSFSMAGLPPFNGFLSKEMFFKAIISIQQFDLISTQSVTILFPLIAWIASVFTFVYCMIIVFQTFLGKFHPERIEGIVEEPPVGMLIAPVILGLFVIAIFFYPNVISHYMLKPAMISIFPTIISELTFSHISAWHGFTKELGMTIGVIVLGTILYKTFPYWERVYRVFSEKWSFDALYNYTLTSIENISFKITSLYMTESLRHYLIYIHLFLIISIGSLFYYTDAFTFDMSKDSPVHTFELTLAMIMVVASIMILFAKTRLTAILLNGLLGFSIAMFFVLFRAPDLALTQLVVETVTTALFLLCFYFLPEWKKEVSKRKTKIINMIISISVGITFTLIALSVNSGKLFETISIYFEKADELAGGKNIVNTILADFRAFDTMLEVVVLFIAGIGVYSLIHMKKKNEADNIENK